MNEQYDMVRDFMRTFGQTVPDNAALPNVEVAHFRRDIINEEAEELLKSTDLVEYYDAILDLIYVVLGAAAAAGISAEALSAGFAEVHRSNMSKLWTRDEIDEGVPVDARVNRVGDRFIVRRQDGKVLKSPSYSPARLTPILWRNA